MMDFVFKEKIDTDKKTAINPITKVEQLTNLRRKHKEEEAEQIVQEVEQQKEEDRENRRSSRHMIRGILYIIGMSLSVAGSIVDILSDVPHKVAYLLIFAGIIILWASDRLTDQKKKEQEGVS